MQSGKNKFLYLLNLLSKGGYTKKEIIENFKKNGIKITNSTISNYINLYKQNDFQINEKIAFNKEKIFTLHEEIPTINLNEEELNIISDIKKLLRAQKDYIQIRKAIRLFYKIAQYIPDEETKDIFINFGYFSTLNWNIIEELEKHCKEKNLITICYNLPYDNNREITIHADNIISSNYSERIYLSGILNGAKQFSSLPIDKIKSIKRIDEKNKKFDIETDTITYVVSSRIYKKSAKDTKEKIIQRKKDKLIIQRPIDDEFYLLQRLLYFCPDLYYISDEKIKNLLKEKLEKIKNNYGRNLDK